MPAPTATSPRSAALARRVVDRLTGTRGLRRVWARNPRLLVAMHACVGALAVTEPLRLLARAAAGRPATGSYRLGAGTQTIRLRHTLGDVWVLDEIFNRGVYLPPPDVEAALDARGGPRHLADLGAHIGAVSLQYLARYPAADLVAFEPNADSRRLLEANVAANGLGPRVSVVAAAAGAAAGVVQLHGASVLSHVVRGDAERPEHLAAFSDEFEAGDVTEVPIVDVFAQLADVDLLKMDIEGGEWEILADPRFAALPLVALVLEFHQLGAPGPDPRTAVLAQLSAAGFEVGEPFDERNGEGVVWAHRRPEAA